MRGPKIQTLRENRLVRAGLFRSDWRGGLGLAEDKAERTHLNLVAVAEQGRLADAAAVEVRAVCAARGFLGMNLLLYRKAHLQHHEMEQTIGEDIDAHLYRPALETPPGWARLAILLTGVIKTTILKIARKFSTNPQYGERVLSVPPDWLQLGLIAAAQALIFAAFAWAGHWWLYFTHWALPLVGVAQLLDELRTFVEHGYRYLYSNDGKRIDDFPQTTIDVRTGKLGQYLFAPFGFHLHLAHHTLLTVPFHKLPELVPLLKEEYQDYPDPIEVSYPVLFWRMIWKDAKVNAAPVHANPVQA